MQRPSVGETFTAKIDRISNAGNGIIELKSGHINVGQVTRDSVGEEIECLLVNKTKARCLTVEYQDRDHDHQIAGSVEFCPQCHSLMKKNNGEWHCNQCDYKITIDSDATVTKSEKTTDIQSATPTESNADRSSNIEKLREEAVENAVDKVPEDAISTSQVAYYNRSIEVKRYVKTRANGVCEGCGEPAPFTSKTGEPYLHVHHIFELSDGGSDTPDTVIALCPNCHYRVHHGEDGKEYNQRLFRIIQFLENG